MAACLKQRFDKTLADQLLFLAVRPQWLKGLMQDPVYRRTLIELYDQHNDSTLLGFCLREISKMGHHREIAAVIRESEYFAVFNDLLVDMVARVSRSNASEVVALTEDLKRSCCSSEYMFLYANRLFLEVEQGLTDEMEAERAKAGPEAGHSSSLQIRMEIFSGLRCKVRRLRQELEGAAIWNGLADGTRLDGTAQFALRLAGTFAPTATITANSSAESVIVFELSDMLKANAMSATHAQRLCQQYLQLPPGESGDETTVTDTHLGALPAPLHYLRHPQVLKLCVDALIHPQHANQAPARVATLLALACVHDDAPAATAASMTTLHQARALEIGALQADLLAARALCSDIIRSAYGNTDFDKVLQLVELVRQPCISMAVLRWIDYHVTAGPLVSNAALLTVLPTFFQLLVTAIEQQPLQRPDCFAVLCTILSISSLASADDDASNKHFAKETKENYTIMNVHENCVECIVTLMGAGFAIIPMTFLLSKVEAFDIVLLRRALRLILSSVRPPFSKTFAPLLYSFIQRCNSATTLSQKWTKEEAALFSAFRRDLDNEEEDLFCAEGPDPAKIAVLETIDAIVSSSSSDK